MTSSIFFGGSVLAAMIAGTIALFAPCCISVMLPLPNWAGAFILLALNGGLAWYALRQVGARMEEGEECEEINPSQETETPLVQLLMVSQAYTANGYGMMGNSRDGHTFIVVGPDGRIRWRADYGGSPNYTMYVPISNLVADIRAGLNGGSS